VKFTGPGPLASDKVFQVERGGGVLGIATDLEKAGIISDATIFAVAAKGTQLTGNGFYLKAGEYQFKQAMSMRDAMNLIASGKYITYSILIPEGWTTAQALDSVRENEVLTGDISLTPAEGQIMPDTYKVQRGESRDRIVKLMMTSSQKLMDELWPLRAEDAPVKTPAEALTLASIIEKETSKSEERPRVASVFANRLRQGMRLQSDPTIIYGITGGKAKLDRPLTKQDIDEATPYNTYRINGLPPGPIANPGRASLEAALSPAKTKDLYFVADGSGGHVFAETLEDHRVNVRKWREIEKKRNQGGDEAPVMDETDAAGGASAPPAPAPEATPGQQVQNSSLPAVADIAATEQNAGNPAPEPEADSTATEPDNAGQVAVPSDQAAAIVPLPRPRPDNLGAAANTAAVNTAVADVALDLKPGSVIKGANGLIPIPVPKPKLP